MFERGRAPKGVLLGCITSTLTLLRSGKTPPFGKKRHPYRHDYGNLMLIHKEKKRRIMIGIVVR